MTGLPGSEDQASMFCDGSRALIPAHARIGCGGDLAI